MINQWISESVIAHLVNKMMYEYCIAAQLAASQEELSSMSEWVRTLGR
jgi:hypothetical protein